MERRGIVPKVIEHEAVDTLDAALVACNIDQLQTMVVEPQLLADDEGVVLALFPHGQCLSVSAVNRLLDRKLEALPQEQWHDHVPDCDVPFIPPTGAAYGFSVVSDNSLLKSRDLVMPSGLRTALVELDGRNFRLLLSGGARGKLVDSDASASRQGPALQDMATQLQSLHRLPPVPAIALQVMRLTVDPDTSARDLAALIECDPSLAAQILRYARSALFNYPGEINSVQEAVTRVLGFDRVAHLAVGIAASRAFKVPTEGMLGLESFWRHSLHCARLSQKIARLAPSEQNINSDLAYLCGLLHNLGLLLMAHLYPNEFRRLSEMREVDLEKPLNELEADIFTRHGGEDPLPIGHATAGSILLKLWDMPDAVVKTAGLHENPDYQGTNDGYVHCVRLANALLKKEGIGDEFNPDDPRVPADCLGIRLEQVEKLESTIGEVAAELDELARGLSR